MSVTKLSRDSSKDNRVLRVHRFLRDKPGSHKLTVMHWTGFDKVDGLTEHVAFENAVLKLDAALRQRGERVVRTENHSFSIGAA